MTARQPTDEEWNRMGLADRMNYARRAAAGLPPANPYGAGKELAERRAADQKTLDAATVTRKPNVPARRYAAATDAEWAALSPTERIEHSRRAKPEPKAAPRTRAMTGLEMVEAGWRP